MKYTEFAKKIAKENDAQFIESRPNWNGKEVWAMLFYDPTSGDEMPCTGYPEFIVMDKDGYFITEADTAMDYMRYLNQNYDYDEDDNIIGFEPELVKVE